MKTPKEIGQRELKLINKERKIFTSRKARNNRVLLYWTLSTWGIALGIGYFNYPDLLNAMVFCSIVFPLIGLWNYLEERTKIIKGLKSLDFLIENNKLNSLRVKSSRFYQLVEEDDEGEYYVYELDNNQLLSIGGQDFYPTKKFPNSDFEVIEGEGINGEIVIFDIICYGEKINPIKKITGQEKQMLFSNPKYPNPEIYEIVAGNLETVEGWIKETAHNTI